MNSGPHKESSNKVHHETIIDEVKKDFVYLEGGWGWVIVMATSINMGLILGICNNYSLVYNKLVIVYQDTENHVFYAAWIGSFSNGLKYFLCMFGTFLVSFFSPKSVGVAGGVITATSFLACSFVTNIKVYFLTYGVCLAIGTALLLAASLAILPHYFKKKLAFANGIVNCFASIITVILSFITSLVLDKFDLPEAFYFFTALNLISGLLCFLYTSRLPESENKSLVKRIKYGFGLDVFKKHKFVIWCLATFIAFFGWLIPIVNIDHYSVTKFPDYNPVIINVVFGLVAGLSSIVFGRLGDLTKFNRVHYHTFAYFFYGIFQILLPHANSFSTFMLILVVLAIMDGIWLGYRVTIATDLAESSEYSNQASGYYHAAMSPMAIVGPAAAGKIYEIYHSYDLALYIGGLSCLTASFILIVLILIPDLFEYYQLKNQIRC